MQIRFFSQDLFFDATTGKTVEYTISGYTTNIPQQDVISDTRILLNTSNSLLFIGTDMQDNDIFLYERTRDTGSQVELEYVFIPLNGKALPTSYSGRDGYTANVLSLMLEAKDSLLINYASPDVGTHFDLAKAPNVVLNNGEPERLTDGQGTDEAEIIVTDDADDEIDALGGDDTIAARGGNDRISGGDGNDRISASNGNDTVYGDDGNDVIGGGLGDDWISGGNGNDTIGSGQGDDSIYGGNGSDRIAASFGDDTVIGGAWDDRIAGAAGDDSIRGDGGNDNIGGGYGADTISAGNGNDTVGAGQQDDIVYGWEGSDILNGNNGHDSIDGGDGNDTINGGDHNDTMKGGHGADVFYFRVYRDGDVDRITDFESGEDKIQLRGTFDALEISDTGHDILIERNGHQIIVEGVSNLTADDFIFM